MKKKMERNREMRRLYTKGHNLGYLAHRYGISKPRVHETIFGRPSRQDPVKMAAMSGVPVADLRPGIVYDAAWLLNLAAKILEDPERAFYLEAETLREMKEVAYSLGAGRDDDNREEL